MISFKYRTHQIDVADWAPHLPWPDRIAVDGEEMVFAEWQSVGGKQILFYHKPEELRRFRVEAQALRRAQKKAEDDEKANGFRRLREGKGLTQQALAFAAGVNIRQIQKLEAGEIRLGNLTLANAAKLADALGISMEALLAEGEQ